VRQAAGGGGVGLSQLAAATMGQGGKMRSRAWPRGGEGESWVWDGMSDLIRTTGAVGFDRARERTV